MTFVTGPQHDPAPVRAALTGALADLAPAHRKLLGLRAIVVLPDSDYDLPMPPDPEALVA